MFKLNQRKKQQIKTKIKLSRFFYWFLIISGVSFPVYFMHAAISCSVTTQASCNGSGYTTLLRMSGGNNAHAELPSQSTSNYSNNVICCSSISSISNSCSLSNKQVFLRLSGVTNGTVQESSINTYGTDACLSDNIGNDVIIVGYQNSNCSGYDTTVASISSSDNAHIGDANAYTRKICATVIPQTITFDIDTSTTDTNTNAPYSVDLGTLTTSQASNSDNSTINSIWMDIDTNASGGVVVSVVSQKGALKSNSNPGSVIPSSTSTMAPGNANYGLCVASVTQTSGGTLSKSSPFNGSPCTSGHVNSVGAVSTSPLNILSVSSGLTGGRSEIRINAENSVTTPAHNDYTDTLTFIATGTF